MLSLLILFWLDAATITTASAGQIGTHDVAVRTIQMSLAALQLSRWGVPWQLTSYIFPSYRGPLTPSTHHAGCMYWSFRCLRYFQILLIFILLFLRERCGFSREEDML